MDKANSLSTIKSASAAIAFFRKINLFNFLPTLAPKECMMRTTTARKFGLSAKRVKDPFLWFQLVDFAILYAIYNQGYCHLVVSTMAILSSGAMCRYIDVSQHRWRNVQFDNDLKYFEITFESRNNFQIRQGNKVSVATIDALVCPLKLLLKLKLNDVNYSPYSFIFIVSNFNGRCVAENPPQTIPYDLAIKCAQYMRYLSLWFGSVLELSIVELKTQYGSQSGRIGVASATSNASI